MLSYLQSTEDLRRLTAYPVLLADKLKAETSKNCSHKYYLYYDYNLTSVPKFYFDHVPKSALIFQPSASVRVYLWNTCVHE